MSKIPSIKPKELIKVLQKSGFYIARIKGSHYIMFRDSDRKITSVPYHSDRDIPTGTLLSVDELINLL